jgi:hypothetical protein
MSPPKRDAALLLVGGMALAESTPLCISYAVPGSAVYHRNVMVFGLQAIPYLVCAAIWLPWRSPDAGSAAYWLSLALLVVACVLYVPSWVKPRAAGDMVGLGYILICLVTTGAIRDDLARCRHRPGGGRGVCLTPSSGGRRAGRRGAGGSAPIASRTSRQYPAAGRRFHTAASRATGPVASAPRAPRATFSS